MAAFRKIHVMLTALLLAGVGQVYGDYDQSSAYDNCGPTSCSCAPACRGKGFISADLLYWRASQEGLDECFPIENFDYISSYGDIFSKFRGKGKDYHFNWDTGFRLGTGYEFAGGLGIATYWTHFHSHSNIRHRNEYSLSHEQENRWKLDFDVVDIVGGHKIDLGPCFALRPFGGLRGARIEQKVHKDFVSKDAFDFDFDLDTAFFISDLIPYGYSTSDFATLSAHNKQRFLGIGPLIGVDADWKLGCGFSLYANASVSLLYGHFHVRLKESEEFENGAEYCDVKRDLCACQWVVDAGIGVRWQTCLCGGIVWLQLGLEHHSYFNQNRVGNYGDLCLDGGNLSAGFAF